MSRVNYLMNFNQPWAVKRNLSDFFLREVIYWRVFLGAVVSMIWSSWIPEVSELALGVSAAKPVELHVR